MKKFDDNNSNINGDVTKAQLKRPLLKAQRLEDLACISIVISNPDSAQ